jgi:cohesin complex subunit SA-1/2
MNNIPSFERSGGILTNLQLADIVKHNGRLISHAVKRLVEDYESDPKSVIFQILTMLFEVILT